jgi:hypothetical protein
MRTCRPARDSGAPERAPVPGCARAPGHLQKAPCPRFTLRPGKFCENCLYAVRK